ncbi:MAG: hypothetical protein EA415_04510 [Sphaerobacteraceae bacterium]|nr:MAG: hypothetical protein EA415_04510 [Sphaerobacteraceae bacterium]
MSANGAGAHDQPQTPKLMLERVVQTLSDAGFYAYPHIDDQNRWSVSIDTDEGHVDVRLGGGVYVLEAWDTSPGLFWEEQNERRFHALERRARIVMPAIARGLVGDGEELWWDEQEHGVGARVSTRVPYEDILHIPKYAMQLLNMLNDLLGEAERRLLD